MILTTLRMQKLRGKYEKPKLSDFFEPMPPKQRYLRGLIGVGTACFSLYMYMLIQIEKVSDDELFKVGMHRYFEGVRARDEYLATLIKNTPETTFKPGDNSFNPPTTNNNQK